MDYPGKHLSIWCNGTAKPGIHGSPFPTAIATFPNALGQARGHGLEDRCPSRRSAPGETPDRRIPGRIGSIQHPAPIRDVVQRQPGRPAERTGQMVDRGIRGDHQVEALSSAAESTKASGPSSKPSPGTSTGMPAGRSLQLLEPEVLLQAYQAYAGHLRDRKEFRQRNRTARVDLALGIALPTDADVEMPAIEAMRPALDQRRFRAADKARTAASPSGPMPR